MKKYGLLMVSFLALTFSVSAEEAEEEDIQFEEEGCENQDLCVPEEDPEVSYSRRYRCRHRYCDFYDYEDKDIDATWPGKNENSFLEEMMR